VLKLKRLELPELQFDSLLTHKIEAMLTNCSQSLTVEIDVRKYFFSQRVIGPWKSLPVCNENFRSIAILTTFDAIIRKLVYILSVA